MVSSISIVSVLFFFIISVKPGSLEKIDILPYNCSCLNVSWSNPHPARLKQYMLKYSSRWLGDTKVRGRLEGDTYKHTLSNFYRPQINDIFHEGPSIEGILSVCSNGHAWSIRMAAMVCYFKM